MLIENQEYPENGCSPTFFCQTCMASTEGQQVDIMLNGFKPKQSGINTAAD